MRGIGAVRHRRKQGFEEWISEHYLAIGVPAIALHLPRTDQLSGHTIRLVRKACYFDGIANGRIEVILSIGGASSSRLMALSTVDRILGLPADVPNGSFYGRLVDLTQVVPTLWGRATVRKKQPPQHQFIRAGRPFCVVENDAPFDDVIEPSVRISSVSINAELFVARGSGSIEKLLLSAPDARQQRIRRSDFRHEARYLRTCIFRLLQNVESLSLLFAFDLAKVSDDRVQNLLNEYTRQILRTARRVERYPTQTLVDYAYSSFFRLYPGRVDAIRAWLQASGIRPNIARKVLDLIDVSISATINVYIQEAVMGDKYENINSTGQGIAIGRGATATVSGGTNAIANAADVQAALSALAEHIKGLNKEDSSTEAILIEVAAKKAADGDEKGAAALLKKSARWVLDIAKSAGSAALAAFFKTHLGI